MTHLKNLLKDVRMTIANPDSWIKYSLARNATGQECKPTDYAAAKFCLLGAVEKVTGSTESKDFANICDALKNNIDSEYISIFNDSHTHEEVLNMLNRAINSLNSKE